MTWYMRCEFIGNVNGHFSVSFSSIRRLRV